MPTGGVQMKKKYYLGLDIGGTKCSASVGQVQGNKLLILDKKETSTTSSPEETLEKLSDHIYMCMQKYPLERVGISCGGPLDTHNGVILSPPNLIGWEQFPIVKYVSEKFGLTAKLENDANACAVAEWRFGAGIGTQNMIFLTFGTGLGAGLILNERIYSGTNGNAGEVGHIRLAQSGPVGFGKKGSFEGFCSGGGISRLAAEMARVEKELPSCIEKMGGFEQITTKELSRYASEGDKFARKVFAKSGKMLGQGLSVLIDLLNPEMIVLGGVFMRASELLIPTMQKELVKETLGCSVNVCKIVPAALSENIGDIAAIAVAAYGG